MTYVNTITSLGCIAAAIPPIALIGLVSCVCMKAPHHQARHEPNDPTARVAMFAIALLTTAFLAYHSPGVTIPYLKTRLHFENIEATAVGGLIVPLAMVITGFFFSLCLASIPPLGSNSTHPRFQFR